MPRYIIEVSYNGTAFHGSQIQAEQPTVQLALNKALSTVCRTVIETYGASRTDDGVHALGNMYHFDVENAIDEKLAYKLNAILPNTLSIMHIYQVAADANARFDAISRTYRYKIYFQKDPFLHQRALFYPYPFNESLLYQTANIIKEYKDFTSFSKKNSQTFTNNCTIFESYWERKDNQLHYIVCANRFLRGMVRALVGTQLKAAKNNITIEDFRRIIEAKDCSLADFSVTGNGLYLEKINYPTDYLMPVKQYKINEYGR